MAQRTTHRSHTASAARVAVAVLVSSVAGPAGAQTGTTGEWRVQGGDNGYTRYAPLDQINADTVNDLDIAWCRPPVDETVLARWPELRFSNNLRSTPSMIDGVLYASNGIGLVEAFDPATGQTIWVQDLPFLGDETPRGTANRGVGYWEDDSGSARRILSVHARRSAVTRFLIKLAFDIGPESGLTPGESICAG